jgi:hypothetical protein
MFHHQIPFYMLSLDHGFGGSSRETSLALGRQDMVLSGTPKLDLGTPRIFPLELAIKIEACQKNLNRLREWECSHLNRWFE